MLQAPSEILTVLRALRLPSGPHANAVFNALLDHGHVEKLALVEVLPSPLRLHVAPAAYSVQPCNSSLPGTKLHQGQESGIVE